MGINQSCSSSALSGRTYNSIGIVASKVELNVSPVL
jgi:hypothetical protein